MAEALLWGLLASSPVLVGGFLAQRVRIPTGVLGLIRAFGAGVLRRSGRAPEGGRAMLTAQLTRLGDHPLVGCGCGAPRVEIAASAEQRDLLLGAAQSGLVRSTQDT